MNNIDIDYINLVKYCFKYLNILIYLISILLIIKLILLIIINSLFLAILFLAIFFLAIDNIMNVNIEKNKELITKISVVY